MEQSEPARPLLERLRSGVYGINRIALCTEAADEIERLRATGNGVDPVAAAYAFLSLSALLDRRRPRQLLSGL